MGASQSLEVGFPVFPSSRPTSSHRITGPNHINKSNLKSGNGRRVPRRLSKYRSVAVGRPSVALATDDTFAIDHRHHSLTVDPTAVQSSQNHPLLPTDIPVATNLPLTTSQPPRPPRFSASIPDASFPPNSIHLERQSMHSPPYHNSKSSSQDSSSIRNRSVSLSSLPATASSQPGSLIPAIPTLPVELEQRQRLATVSMQSITSSNPQATPRPTPPHRSPSVPQMTLSSQQLAQRKSEVSQHTWKSCHPPVVGAAASAMEVNGDLATMNVHDIDKADLEAAADVASIAEQVFLHHSHENSYRQCSLTRTHHTEDDFRNDQHHLVQPHHTRARPYSQLVYLPEHHHHGHLDPADLSILLPSASSSAASRRRSQPRAFGLTARPSRHTMNPLLAMSSASMATQSIASSTMGTAGVTKKTTRVSRFSLGSVGSMSSNVAKNDVTSTATSVTTCDTQTSTTKASTTLSPPVTQNKTCMQQTSLQHQFQGGLHLRMPTLTDAALPSSTTLEMMEGANESLTVSENDIVIDAASTTSSEPVKFSSPPTITKVDADGDVTMEEEDECRGDKLRRHQDQARHLKTIPSVEKPLRAVVRPSHPSHRSTPSSSSLSVVTAAPFWDENRATTPSDLHYQQLGAMQFGTLRITNGSPATIASSPFSPCGETASASASNVFHAGPTLSVGGGMRSSPLASCTSASQTHIHETLQKLEGTAPNTPSYEMEEISLEKALQMSPGEVELISPVSMTESFAAAASTLSPSTMLTSATKHDDAELSRTDSCYSATSVTGKQDKKKFMTASPQSVDRDMREDVSPTSSKALGSRPLHDTAMGSSKKLSQSSSSTQKPKKLVANPPVSLRMSTHQVSGVTSPNAMTLSNEGDVSSCHEKSVAHDPADQGVTVRRKSLSRAVGKMQLQRLLSSKKKKQQKGTGSDEAGVPSLVVDGSEGRRDSFSVAPVPPSSSSSSRTKPLKIQSYHSRYRSLSESLPPVSSSHHTASTVRDVPATATVPRPPLEILRHSVEEDKPQRRKSLKLVASSVVAAISSRGRSFRKSVSPSASVSTNGPGKTGSQSTNSGSGTGNVGGQQAENHGQQQQGEGAETSISERALAAAKEDALAQEQAEAAAAAAAAASAGTETTGSLGSVRFQDLMVEQQIPMFGSNTLPSPTADSDTEFDNYNYVSGTHRDTLGHAGTRTSTFVGEDEFMADPHSAFLAAAAANTTSSTAAVPMGRSDSASSLQSLAPGHRHSTLFTQQQPMIQPLRHSGRSLSMMATPSSSHVQYQNPASSSASPGSLSSSSSKDSEKDWFGPLPVLQTRHSPSRRTSTHHSYFLQQKQQHFLQEQEQQHGHAHKAHQSLYVPKRGSVLESDMLGMVPSVFVTKPSPSSSSMIPPFPRSRLSLDEDEVASRWLSHGPIRRATAPVRG